MKKILLATTLFTSLLFSIEIGQVPSPLTLDGENGGLVSGGAWDSSMIKGKVYFVVYVDPDEKDTNTELYDKVKAMNYDHEKYGSMVIINLAATWKPNFIIESLLKKKQKKFPNSIYVKDKKSVLVKQWELADNSADVLVFNKKGSLIYTHTGQVEDEEISKIIKLISDNL